MSFESPKSKPIPDEELLFPNKKSTDTTDTRVTKDEEPVVIPEWAKGAYKHAQMPTPPDIILNNVTRPEAMEDAREKGIGFYIVKRNNKQTKVMELSVFVSDEDKKIKEFYCIRKSEPPFYEISNRSLPDRIVDMREILQSSTLGMSEETFNKLNKVLFGIFVEDRS